MVQNAIALHPYCTLQPAALKHTTEMYFALLGQYTVGIVR